MYHTWNSKKKRYFCGVLIWKRELKKVIYASGKKNAYSKISSSNFLNCNNKKLGCWRIKKMNDQSISIKNCQKSVQAIQFCTHKIARHYLGATDPCLHSVSKEGKTAGFRTAARMIFSAIKQLFSCFSGNTEDRSPKAILLVKEAIAGSKKGSSISTTNRILCLAS